MKSVLSDSVNEYHVYIYIYCIPVLLLPGDGWSLFKNFYYLYKIKQYIVISYRNILNYLQIELK